MALNRRWPSQASVITRQISSPRVYTNRWEKPTPPPPIRSTGFLLALQVRPGKLPPKPKPKDEYDTTYIPLEVVILGFPTQFSGLRVWDAPGQLLELCMVAEADAPSGMGGVWKVNKNGTLYAVYLVETGDSNASPVRVQTSTGTKSARVKT